MNFYNGLILGLMIGLVIAGIGMFSLSSAWRNHEENRVSVLITEGAKVCAEQCVNRFILSEGTGLSMYNKSTITYSNNTSSGWNESKAPSGRLYFTKSHNNITTVYSDELDLP